MSNHTPGPWKIGIDGHMIVDAKGEGNLIAGVARMNDNREADARLIAAGPELLEAAKAAQCLTMLVSRVGEPWRSDLNYVLDLCKAAIAKAEGEVK